MTKIYQVRICKALSLSFADNESFVYDHTFSFIIIIIIIIIIVVFMAVGIATCNWVDGPGIENKLGHDFLHPSRLVLKPTSLPCTTGTGTLSRGKAAGRDVDYTLPCSTEVTE